MKLKGKFRKRKNLVICPICHLELSANDVNINGLVVCPVCGAVIEIIKSEGQKIPVVHNVETKRPQPLFRLHTIATHFSIGLLPVAMLAQIWLFFARASGELLGNLDLLLPMCFLFLSIVLIGGILTFATGFVDWKRKYRGRNYEIITRKIRWSIVLFILLSFAIFLFWIELFGWSFLTQIFALGVIAKIGHLGGFLVFGK